MGGPPNRTFEGPYVVSRGKIHRSHKALKSKANTPASEGATKTLIPYSVLDTCELCQTQLAQRHDRALRDTMRKKPYFTHFSRGSKMQRGRPALPPLLYAVRLLLGHRVKHTYLVHPAHNRLARKARKIRVFRSAVRSSLPTQSLQRRLQKIYVVENAIRGKAFYRRGAMQRYAICMGGDASSADAGAVTRG